MPNNAVAYPLINQERVILVREYASRRGRTTPPPLIRIGLRLRGRLSTDILKSALDDLIQRHPALRTAFLENPNVTASQREAYLEEFARTGIVRGGLYTQLLLQDAEADIRTVSLTGLGAAQQESALRNLLVEESSRPFNQRFPPLIRSLLVQTDTDEQLLILIVDHLVCDGVSASVISNDLKELYAARADGRTPGLTPSPLSALDFAAWQQAACCSSYFDESIRYWRRQWAEFASARVAFDDLPFALSPPSEPDFVFGTEHSEIAPSDADAIRSFARQHRMTPFIVFLTAFALVLSRYTERPRVAIWTHLSNRRMDPKRSGVGWFANSHLLGIDLTRQAAGLELLRHVRAVVAKALSCEEVPLSHLWRSLRCSPRFPDVTPLLDYQTSAGPRYESDPFSEGLQFARIALPDSTTPRLSALGVYINDAGSIRLSSKFPIKRFPREAIRRLLQELTATALALVKDRASSQIASERTFSRRPNAMNEFVLLDGTLLPDPRVSALPKTKDTSDALCRSA